MKGIVVVLEELEKFIYKVLLWLILIPKTLVQVFLHPNWAPAYIKQELGEGNSRFDEYLSPVVLLFIVALLPLVAWSFLPTYGVEINSASVDNPTPNRSLDFDAKIRFISTATDGFVTTYWRIEKEVQNDSGYTYPTVKLTRYTNNPKEMDSSDYFYYYPIDNNTIQDIYSDNFTEPGGYWLVVDANKFDERGNLIEKYSNEIYVYIPADSQENIYISTNRQSSKPNDNSFVENVSNKFKSEETYLLALGLLIPPLLFALATKWLRGTPLSEDVLRETFYVQCYFFAPLGFVFWASSYAFYFVTPDVFYNFDSNGSLLTLLPTLLVIFWFMSVQIHVIAEERNISRWKSFGIVMGCMTLLIAGAVLIANIHTPQVQDSARRIAIWTYPLIAIGLLTAYHWLIVRRNRDEKQKASRGDVILAVVILFVIASTLMAVLMAGRTVQTNPQINVTEQSLIAQSAPTLVFIATQQEATSISQATEQPAALESTNTPEPAQSDTPTPAQQISDTATSESSAVLDTPTAEQVVSTVTQKVDEQNYYQEEFSGDLKTWPYFMTRGDDTAVKFSIDNQKLYVQLLQLNDMKPWFYMVNNAFTYSDVRVEVSTTNNGVNANGVGLVCRYSDAGWYEFNISNSGLYTIYAYDAGNRVYSTIATGGSPAIHTGLETNVYTAVCRGNELTLIVNDTLVTTVQETKLNFINGLIGIAVSSPEGLPVSVDFEYVKVSAP